MIPYSATLATKYYKLRMFNLGYHIKYEPVNLACPQLDSTLVKLSLLGIPKLTFFNYLIWKTVVLIGLYKKHIDLTLPNENIIFHIKDPFIKICEDRFLSTEHFKP
jgi:hypothetical protein